MHTGKLKQLYILGIKTLIFIIPFLPLYVSSSSIFQYIEGRNFAFRILVELATVLWLGLVVIDKEYRPRNSPLLSSLLIFTLIVGVADLFGVNPYKSFWSNYERMEGYLTILHLLFYFMVTSSILKSPKDRTAFLTAFFIAGAAVALYSLHHKLIQGFPHREYGIIGHPTFLASYMLLVIFTGFLLFLNERGKFLKGIIFSTIVLFIYVIYLTAARGPILAGLSGVIFFSLFYIFGRPNTPNERLHRKLAMSVAALCVLLPAAFLIFYETPDLPQKFDEFQEAAPRFATATMDESISSRVAAWKVAWEGIKERPFLGWGQENFISVYATGPLRYGQNLGMDRPHNIVLEWLVNAGIPGLLSYLSIFGAAFYVIRNARRNNLIAKAGAVTLVTAFVVYFLQNLSIFDTINTYLVFFGLLAYIDSFNYRELKLSESSVPSKRAGTKSVIVVVLALTLFSVTSYFIHYKPARESYLANRIGFVLKEKGDPADRYRSFLPVRKDFLEALSLKTFGDAEVMALMHALADTILKYRLFDIEGAIQFVQTTAKEIPLIIDADPYNLNNWMTAINFYNDIGAYEPSYIAKAEKLIKACMRLGPQNQWPYLALADNFILKKDYDNAVLTVKKVVDQDPLNDQLQIRLALTGILASREDVLYSALEDLAKIRAPKARDMASGGRPVLTEKELLVFEAAAKEAGLDPAEFRATVKKLSEK
ncbi:MAG: hypothetical protein C4560_06035 [Nitrospiraceae bacterium]|nr:MAG: hypothetical protein C4560_06035 [Nitrospiraceae bacterium]